MAVTSRIIEKNSKKISNPTNSGTSATRKGFKSAKHNYEATSLNMPGWPGYTWDSVQQKWRVSTSIPGVLWLQDPSKFSAKTNQLIDHILDGIANHPLHPDHHMDGMTTLKERYYDVFANRSYVVKFPDSGHEQLVALQIGYKKASDSGASPVFVWVLGGSDGDIAPWVSEGSSRINTTSAGTFHPDANHVDRINDLIKMI